VSDDNKKKLFFHDVINQTHGMLLFLESKETLGPADISLLKNEVKLLQSFMQDHFGYQHKNINKSENAIIESIKKLIEIYFSTKTTDITFYINGQKQGELDLVPFYRIVHNLVKNMSEAQTPNAKIELTFTAEGLSVTTQNTISDQNALMREGGLGLHSIATLAADHQGNFHYEIHEKLWVNHLFWPYKNSSTTKKIAA
jgi:hypothetical protein